MSFTPKYTITERLLANIKRITSLVAELNNRRFPNIILLEMERTAREVSSFSSTSIEGNPLPLTEVKKILKSKPANIRDSEKEVINYNQALQDLNLKLKEGKAKVSLPLILTIQKQVIEELLPEFDVGLRQKPVVVNDPRSGQVVYLPPDVKDVAVMLDDLVAFVRSNSSKIDPLVLAGIFHKQMVLIHPFMDGNGRSTRLATKVLLAEMGLDTFNLFSFENYYNNNVTKYFQIVGEFGNYYDLAEKIDFTSWLEYFTEGIIDELLRVQKLFPKIPVSPETKLENYHFKILSFIREKGTITHREYAKLVDRAKPTRALDFQRLVKIGLIERKGKGRATYYILKNK
jgi:Fic family protein